MKKVFMIFCVVSGLLYGQTFNKSQIKNKFEYKNDYYQTEKKIDTALETMSSLGFLWTEKGLLHLYDYKFKDGIIKADLKKAEYCLKKAYSLGDISSYYLLPVALYADGKPMEAMNILEKRMKFILSLEYLSENVQKEYVRLSNFYATIVIGSKLDKNHVQKAITYSFDVANNLKDSLSQLQIGILYKILGKNEVSNHFVLQACTNKNKTKFVDDYCKNRLEIIKKKKCKECEIKKRLGLI